jgi:hypothetical protein
MKKDLIIITSFCDNKEKKQTLYHFLDSLQVFRDQYDIMLSSHLFVDDMFYDYIDHFYFNHKNELLTSLDYLQNGWFKPYENYVIWSSYLNYKNTHLAIWNLLVPSIAIAKSFGYEKIHHFEYDSIITDVSELQENSELLNKYDYIFYCGKNSHKKYGAFDSFRVDGIIDEWKLINSESLRPFYENKYPKVPENITYNLITNQRKYLIKDLGILSKKGILLNSQNGQQLYFDAPFYESKTNKLKFVSWNRANQSYSVKIIVNNHHFFNLENVKPDNWNIIEISPNFDEVNKVSVFRNDVLVLDLNFDTTEIKNKFIHYNSVLSNDSLKPTKII